MNASISGFKMGSESKAHTVDFSKWLGGKTPVEEERYNRDEEAGRTGYHVDNRPIEPEKKRFRGPNLLKWIIFLLLILYTLVSYFHAPILKSAGSYLVVKHSLKKTDLIVCLMGGPVERGLEAADLYKTGLAPYIFIGREELPDGTQTLNERGVRFPESRALLIMMLENLGVPGSACLVNDNFVGSTMEEAKVIGDFVRDKGFRSLIVVTSPTHTRRAWLTFENVFKKDDVEVLMAPSRYTKFKPDDWWKTRRYAKEVIVEYQKLIYYTYKYFW